VTFTVDKELESDQKLCIIGSIPELGSWTTFDQIMSPSSEKPKKNYFMSQKNSTWVYNIDFQQDVSFEYKYVVIDNYNPKEQVWEGGENHTNEVVVSDEENP
jgi:hypothetical protein